MGFGMGSFNNSSNSQNVNSSKVDSAFVSQQNQYSTFGQTNNQQKRTNDYKSSAFDFNIGDTNNAGFSLQPKSMPKV